MNSLDQAREAKRALAARLRDDPRVEGIGLSKRQGTYVLQVRLREEVEHGTVPATVRVESGTAEFAVQSEVIGQIHPQGRDNP